MANRRRALMSAQEKIAAGLTAETIPVRFTSSTPVANVVTREINLPPMPEVVDADTEWSYRGWIDHESAHLIFGSHEWPEGVISNDVLRNLSFLLEDTRCNKLMSRRFPGSAINNNESYRVVLSDMLTGADNGLKTAYMVLYDVVGEHESMPEALTKWSQNIDEDNTNLMVLLVGAVPDQIDRAMNLGSQDHAIDIAEEIYEVWKDIFQSLPQSSDGKGVSTPKEFKQKRDEDSSEGKDESGNGSGNEGEEDKCDEKNSTENQSKGSENEGDENESNGDENDENENNTGGSSDDTDSESGDEDEADGNKGGDSDDEGDEESDESGESGEGDSEGNDGDENSEEGDGEGDGEGDDADGNDSNDGEGGGNGDSDDNADSSGSASDSGNEGDSGDGSSDNSGDGSAGSSGTDSGGANGPGGVSDDGTNTDNADAGNEPIDPVKERSEDAAADIMDKLLSGFKSVMDELKARVEDTSIDHGAYAPYTDNDVVEKITPRDHGLRVCTDTYGETKTVSPDEFRAEVRSKMSALHQRLLIDLLTKRRMWVRDKDKGTLDDKRLHRIALGDNRIFKRKLRRPGLDLAVTLVLDMSGSMYGEDQYRCGQLGYILGETLASVGVPFEILGFTTMQTGTIPYSVANNPNITRKSTLRHTIVKDFNETRTQTMLKRLYAVAAWEQGGLTIEGEGVLWAAQRLVQRREARKILIVLCDGSPCGSYQHDCSTAMLSGHLESVIERIERAGIETIGVGINTDAQKRFYKNSVTYTNPETLLTEFYAKFGGILRGEFAAHADAVA